MERFLLFVNLFCLAAYGTAQLFFVGKLTGKRPRPWHFALCLLLLGLAEQLCARLFLPDICAVGVELLVLYGIARRTLRNGRAASCAAALLAVYFSQMSFGVVNALEMLLFPNVVPDSMLRALILLSALASFALCALCYYAVYRMLSLADTRRWPELLLLLLPELFFFFVQLYILNTFYHVLTLPLSSPEIGMHAFLLALQSLGLAAALCTLYAYRRVCQGLAAQASLASLAQAAGAQKAYLAEAQARYERTRAFRHDLQNHLSILSGLLNGGQLDEGRAYLQKLAAVSGSLSLPCQTGRPAADILLGEKLAAARAKNITADVSLALPSSCGIDDIDLCIILANALDNALCACEAVNGERHLRLWGERQGDFYFLAVENTCLPGPTPPMGTGLSNIQTAVKKYGGAMAAEKKGAVFSLSLLLEAVPIAEVRR